ncbi:hypothetical protein [Labrenzia sp. VG12]|uniref:hypothetical protein n=1 Tax=Labrenzia sp. VG12 TaxID=2021862 RepID=UPI001AD94E7F|nr:hypothetical protein [Labrenzia sp. VG12]
MTLGAWSSGFVPGAKTVPVALAVLLLTVSVVSAQSGRPDTRQLTCTQAQALVKQRGSIVMTTGATTFEKFVADARYCRPITNQVRALFAPTRDDPKCAVGFRCHQNIRIR